jgi:hypothetical protein
MIAVSIGVLVAVAAAAIVLVVTGGEDEASAQTVRFQEPTAAGPDPFTAPADVRGRDKVDVGSGPFGGTGSDLVCDRELLIRSLGARPERLREWARVANVDPTERAVADYIRGLRPATLTTDTRVTNHSFRGGRAVAFQAILQAGTAVLVDERGIPVARCRCGNPLLEAIFIPEAKCLGCPPNYRPPAACPPFKCYRRYPHPPGVKRRRRAEPSSEQRGTPSASFSPRTGRQGDRFVLTIRNFRPSSRASFTLRRPDGVVENYSIPTGSNGSGTYTFNPTGGDDVLGDYLATVTDSEGNRATATATLLARQEQQQEDSGGLQCDPPRSQLESEQCAAQEGNAPQNEAPDPNYPCDVDPATPGVQPPASPGEDWLRNCN